ncbi:MAG: hypothetical protein IIC94_05240 [Chloroflexi bacterium]|nr:hypothetical protein [Chloroflexota bacterium]
MFAQYWNAEWTLPTNIPSLVGRAQTPGTERLRADPSGTIHAFAAGIPAGGTYSSEIWYGSKPINGDWTSPQRIFTNPDGGASSVGGIVFDGSGSMHVSISAASGNLSTSEVWYMNRAGNGIWSKPERLDFIPNPKTATATANIFVDDTDTVHLIWNDAGTRTWKHAARTRDGNWLNAEDVTPSTGYATHWLVVMDKGGTFHFVWLSTESQFTNDLYYAFKPPESAISDSFNVSRTTEAWQYTEQNVRQFSIAVSEEGVSHIVWVERTPDWDRANKSEQKLQDFLQTSSLTDEERAMVKDRGVPEHAFYDNKEIRYLTISPTGQPSVARRISFVIQPNEHPWVLCTKTEIEKNPILADQVGITVSGSATHLFFAAGCADHRALFYLHKQPQ